MNTDLNNLDVETQQQILQMQYKIKILLLLRNNDIGDRQSELYTMLLEQMMDDDQLQQGTRYELLFKFREDLEEKYN